MESFRKEIQKLKKEHSKNLDYVSKIEFSNFKNDMKKYDLLIETDSDENYITGMILETKGYFKDNKLLVQLARNQSSKVIGIYSNPYTIDSEKIKIIIIIGEISIGDLITSNDNGYGIKQEDNIVRSYTVGKAIGIPKLISDNKYEVLSLLKIQL